MYSRRSLIMTLAALSIGALSPCGAEDAVTIELSIQNRQFHPAEIVAPANRPIIIKIKNLDKAAAEFESVSLRVEKVIPAGGEGIVRLRALQAGRYQFFDDFNPEAKGVLIVQ